MAEARQCRYPSCGCPIRQNSLGIWYYECREAPDEAALDWEDHNAIPVLRAEVERLTKECDELFLSREVWRQASINFRSKMSKEADNAEYWLAQHNKMASAAEEFCKRALAAEAERDALAARAAAQPSDQGEG